MYTKKKEKKTKVVLVTLAIFCLETLWLNCTVEQAHFCAGRFLAWRYEPFPCPYDMVSMAKCFLAARKTSYDNLLKFWLFMHA